MTKLQYIRKDFLKVKPYEGICCQVVNTAGVVAGLTRALASKFVGLEQMLAKELTLGQVVVYDEYDLCLAAMAVQERHGPANGTDSYKQRREQLHNCLQYVCSCNQGQDLYVPYMMCCGQTGGDDWAVIEAMLEDLPNQVYVCVPNWAEDAAEQLGRLPLSKLPAASTLAIDSVGTALRSMRVA